MFGGIGLDILDGCDVGICAMPGKVDTVIHLAGRSGVRESVEDPAAYWYHNVEVTRRLLSYYRNARIVVASSSSAYEPHLNPYASSKRVIEHIPHDNVVFARLHTVFGSGGRKNMFVQRLLDGTATHVTNHQRDFVYVKDVCLALMLLAKSDVQGIVDVGTGVPTRVFDLAPYLQPRLGEPTERIRTCADTTIIESLGWKPTMTIEQYLEK